MIAYLIKSGLCLLVLFSFYKLFLEPENMHKLKRVYLIGALLFSLILPLITISYSIPIPAEATTGNLVPRNGTVASGSAIPPQEFATTWGLSLIYVAGFLVVGWRFVKNILSIVRDIRVNENRKSWRYVFVLLQEKLVPHTFLNYIFLNKEEFMEDRISQAVLAHEKAHADQKHSVDILFIEFLQVFFWFNPLLHLWKRSIKLNHEFLADSQVVSTNSDAIAYSRLLLEYNQHDHQKALASQINSSIIKKRIIMITKEFSIRRVLFKLGILLPVLAICIYLFSNDVVAKPIPTVSGQEINEALHQDPGKVDIRIESETIYLNGKLVKLQDLTAEIDRLVSGRSEAEIRDFNFHVQIKNVDKEFLQQVNREFQNSRLYKVSGFSLHPHAPPAPPAPVAPGPGSVQPPAPPSAVVPAVHPTPGSAPAPDSVRIMAKREVVRERMREKRQKVREIHMEDRARRMDSIRNLMGNMHEERLAERMAVMEQRKSEMKARRFEKRAKLEAEIDRLREENKRLKEQNKIDEKEGNKGL